MVSYTQVSTVTDSPALLSRLGQAAVAGLKLLAVGLAALSLAIVATITTAVGVTAKVTAEMLSQFAGLIREALPVILGLIPGLARLLCLAFALGATGYAGVQIFQAFGGDWLALVIAVLLAPAPFMMLYVASPGWSQALAAGAAVLIGGAVIHLAPALLRMFMLFVIFAWLLTRKMQKGQNSAESSEDALAESWIE